MIHTTIPDPALTSWIQQWKLDAYEAETLVATEISPKHTPHKAEILWKSHLTHAAKKQV